MSKINETARGVEGPRFPEGPKRGDVSHEFIETTDLIGSIADKFLRVLRREELGLKAMGREVTKLRYADGRFSKIRSILVSSAKRNGPVLKGRVDIGHEPSKKSKKRKS